MNQETHISCQRYSLLPTEVEGVDPLAAPALDRHRSWNQAADKVWRQLDPELWAVTHIPRVVALGAIALLMLGGCATPKVPATPPTTPTPTPPAATSTAAPVAGSVPEALAKVGGDGENLYDQAKAQQWPKMAATLTDLKQKMQQLPMGISGATENQANLNTNVVDLTKAITQKDKIGAMRASNQITRITADMSAPYKPAVPVEVTLLDYDGRELEMGVLSKAPASLKATVTSMHETWKKLRPLVVARGGSAQANKFDLLMARAATAQSPAEYAPIATAVLDQVDGLEKIFTAPTPSK